MKPTNFNEEKYRKLVQRAKLNFTSGFTDLKGVTEEQAGNGGDIFISH